MKIRNGVVALASVAGLILAVTPASPAATSLTTRCVGTAGEVTVPGDLVVPDGESCDVDGTAIHGKVTVGKNANLVVADGQLGAAVVVDQSGYLDVTDTSIDGRVDSRGGYGAMFDAATLHQGYQASASATDPGESFTGFDDTRVASSVRVRGGEMLLDDSRIGGQVSGAGTSYLDMQNARVDGNLAITDNQEGSFLCGNKTRGNASITGSSGLQAGGSGKLGDCSQPNEFSGNMEVSGNDGGVLMQDNVIAGDLSGAGNDPAPTGGDNQIRGTASGQFADLPSATATQRNSGGSRQHPALEDRAVKRKNHAVKQAANAGPAKL